MINFQCKHFTIFKKFLYKCVWSFKKQLFITLSGTLHGKKIYIDFVFKLQKDMRNELRLTAYKQA